MPRWDEEYRDISIALIPDHQYGDPNSFLTDMDKTWRDVVDEALAAIDDLQVPLACLAGIVFTTCKPEEPGEWRVRGGCSQSSILTIFLAETSTWDDIKEIIYHEVRHAWQTHHGIGRTTVDYYDGEKWEYYARYRTEFDALLYSAQFSVKAENRLYYVLRTIDESRCVASIDQFSKGE